MKVLTTHRQHGNHRPGAVCLLARGALLLGLAAAGILPWGCGHEFPLPPLPASIEAPQPGTYNLEAVWSVPNPTDVAVFGVILYVIEDRTRVQAYYSRLTEPRPNALVSPFEDLIHPQHLAFIGGNAKLLAVADSGDMQCKIYTWKGGPPLYSFRDSLWQSFDGLAIDDSLRVYVADAQRDRIDVYSHLGEHLHVVADYGTGVGYVIDPAGLAFARRADRTPVLAAVDAGKNWVQQLDPRSSYLALSRTPIGFDEGELKAPQGISMDTEGKKLYIANTGAGVVLKYDYTGAFEDTVYSPGKAGMRATELDTLRAPRYLCNENELVWVSDPVGDRIVVFRLASY